MMNQLYIGCSGWSYREWVGKFYASSLKPQEYLKFYIEHFKTVEINSTFYHFPTSKTVLTWYQIAPPGFKYTLKASRIITHDLKFHQAQSWVQQMYALCDILQEKMGCLLFQVPPSFVFTPQNLDSILSSLNPSYKNVVEFRHSSWWTPDVFNACKSANIIMCSVSGMKVPEILIPEQSDIYIRFHGNPTYDAVYEEDALIKWSHHIQASKAKNIWIYFNNTRRGHAPYNALYLNKLLS